MRKILVLASAAIVMAACSDASSGPSGPKTATPARAHADFTCRSGYTVAYDADGNPYCVPDPNGNTSAVVRP